MGERWDAEAEEVGGREAAVPSATGPLYILYTGNSIFPSMYTISIYYVPSAAGPDCWAGLLRSIFALFLFLPPSHLMLSWQLCIAASARGTCKIDVIIRYP